MTKTIKHEPPGSVRCHAAYEAEFANICAMDDSFEPEVPRNVSKVIYKNYVPHGTLSSAGTENIGVTATSSPLLTARESNARPQECSGEKEDTGRSPEHPSLGVKGKKRAERPNSDQIRHVNRFFKTMQQKVHDKESRLEGRERQRELKRELQAVLETHDQQMEALIKIANILGGAVETDI